MIEGTAKKLSADFFTRFKQEVAGPEAEEAEAPVVAAIGEEARMSASRPLVLMVGGAVALVVLYYLIGAL